MSILSRFACPLHNSTTPSSRVSLFFCNDTATTEIYTLSLHDALPISCWRRRSTSPRPAVRIGQSSRASRRSEEHTSELQSRRDLVCCLLLEKKKKASGTSGVQQFTHGRNPFMDQGTL